MGFSAESRLNQQPDNSPKQNESLQSFMSSWNNCSTIGPSAGFYRSPPREMWLDAIGNASELIVRTIVAAISAELVRSLF
jgi:hypothetical protein